MSEEKKEIIYTGDCIEILKSIPSESVDLVITDPPYGTKTNPRDTFMIGEFSNVMPLVLPEIFRVLKKDGGDYYDRFRSRIMFPLFAFILVIDLYGFRSCLLGGTGPWRSITRGWQLFRQEMGNTLLTGVFYFILSAIVGVIVLLPALPFGLGMAGRIFNSGFTFDMLWSLIPIFIYMMIAGLVMGGLIRAYFAVLCTKLYRVAEAKQTV